MSLHLQAQPRVEIDPNRHSRRHPQWVPVPMEYVPFGLVQHQRVTAVQSDAHGPDFVGTARVAAIDVEHALIYFDVQWSSFQEEVVNLPASTGMKHVFVSYAGNGLPAVTSGSDSGFHGRSPLRVKAAA